MRLISDLQQLNLQQLQAIDEALEAYLCKQPQYGEGYHKSYRKNRKSFQLLVRQTVALKKIVRTFFQGQLQRIDSLVHLHKIVADERGILAGWITKNGAHIFINDDVTSQAMYQTIQSGGTTLDIHNAQSPKEGLAYSPYPNNGMVISQSEFDPSHVDAFINQNAELLSQAGNHLGLWQENGKIYMDVTKVGEATKATYEAAIASQQEALYNLTTGQNVYTPLSSNYEKAPNFDTNTGKIISGNEGSSTQDSTTSLQEETIYGKNTAKKVNIIDIVSTKINPGDLLATPSWDIEDKDLANTLADGIFPIYTNGAKTTAKNIGIGTTIDSSSAPSQKFLAKYVLQLAGQINDTTKSDIKQAISTSISLGEKRSELTDRINNILDDPYRSEMIAQTESIRAFSQGRLDTLQEIGYDQKQWQWAANSDCPICPALEELGPISIDDTFPTPAFGDVDGPPAHPWCQCSIQGSKSTETTTASEIKGGWITRDGVHVFINDSEDFSKPGVANLETMGLKDAEHMIKYNAVAQIEGARNEGDHTIPSDIAETIYKVDVSMRFTPMDQATFILRSLSPQLQINPNIKTALVNWGKSAEMVYNYRNK